MIKAIDKQSKKFKQQGRPEIRIGVGINSGPMNVGNMGSEFRMAYTVMGDTVNLGSRIEGLTKNYGVDIIVGEMTAKLAPDFCYRGLDKVKVKGKLSAVKIYEPISPELSEKQSFKKELADYHQALYLYQTRDWDGSEKIFNKLNVKKPHKLYDIYLERITHNRQHEPDSGWDGSFTFLTK